MKTKETMELNVKNVISINAIEDMLVTALEGGSNYWYSINRDDLTKMRNWFNAEIKEGRLVRDESIHYMWMDAMFQGCPLKLPIYDAEESDGDNFEELDPLGYLSMETIKEGLALVSEHDRNRYASFFPEYNDGDAEDSDVIFQYIVMKEVVFG